VVIILYPAFFFARPRGGAVLEHAAVVLFFVSYAFWAVRA